MTDKETIKALEYCTNESDGECKECDYDKYCPRCVPKLLEDALDIINRQKAENKRLEKEVNLVSIQFQDLQERYEEAQTEIDRLKIENQAFLAAANSYKLHYNEAINEAIKEFAERLKDKASTVGVDEMYDGQPMYVSVEIIDNLVKEYEKGKQENEFL